MEVFERIAALEWRLQAVEDELAIHKLIVRYGLAVDTGDAAAPSTCTTAGIDIYRASLNRWELARADGGWAIVRRVTRLLGHAEGPGLFRDGLANLAPPP